MSDDISDPKEEYQKTVLSIDTISRLLQMTTDAKRKTYLEGQLAKLRQFRERLESSFDLTGESSGDAQAPQKDERANPAHTLTFLSRIQKRYEKVEIVASARDPEVRDVAIYMTCFGEEYLGLFDRKRLDLDHLTSLELDGFYNAFNQAKRRLDIFCNETEALYEKKDGVKLLQRLKSKQVLLVEVHKFFRKVQKFTEELLEDIKGAQRHCFNGEAKVVMSPTGRTMVLGGLRVKDALQHVHDFSTEVIDHLDIPDFQK